jgi:autotransporter-associated beta strand protein
VVRGLGAAFTGNAVRIPGNTSGNLAVNSISAYIDLPNGIISAHTNITIEIWATPLSPKNWGRVFDFGRTDLAGDGLGAPGEYTGTPGTPAPGVTQSSDDVMLSAAINTDLNQQRFEAKLDGTAVTLDSGLSTTAGVRHHYAITFTDGAGTSGSAGGRWQWYRDGDAIGYLDVNFHLADIEDVNNWLGRSMWSADSNANMDYSEVRLSNVALAPGNVLANYLLGPNYFPSATVTMTNTDVLGTTSFNSAGQWNNGAAPSSGNSYETVNFTMRTPATGSPYTFAGDSLRLSGGYLLYKGTSSSVITINNLTLNGGWVNNAGSAAFTLGGSISVTTNGGTFNGVNAGETVAASLSGGGPLTFLANPATLSGANAAFTGKILIGNGVPGTLIIDSQARLGTAPAAFTTDQLTLNRGTLQTTFSMSLDNANRGILFGPAGGTFNVAAGTTLTLSSPMSIPVTGASVVAGSLTKTGTGTLVLNSPGNTFKGTLFVDTGSSSANDGVVRVANNLVLANAHSPILIRNNTSGSSTLQLDGTAGSIVLPQRLSVACRNSSVAAVQNFAGTNTISGGASLNVGGSFFNLRSESGSLTLDGNYQYVGSTVGNRTFVFNGAGDFRVPGAILNSTNGSVIGISKSGIGTLTLSGGNGYTGTTVVGGGTLIVNGSIAGSAVTVSSSTIGGNGIINAPVTVQSSGTFAPGNSIGTLTINNTLSLSGTTLMELDAANATSDTVQGLTSVTYGGTLSLSNLNGTISATNTFKLFSAATYQGTFSGILPLEPGPDLAWNTNTLATDGTLRITSKIPTPINFSTSNGVLGLSWGAAQTGWRLQVQINSLVPLGWTDVPGAVLTNLVVVPIDPAAEAVYYRLIFP